MQHSRHAQCPDCQDNVSRRDFVKAVGVAASLPLLGSVPPLRAAEARTAHAESAVGRFYESLSDEQRQTICFAFDHDLRNRISANWAITKPEIGDDFYSDAQRSLIDDIVRGVTSEDGYERLQKQMEDDMPNGKNGYHVAVFGTPGSGKFEWELTGRHLTLRADGDSVDGMAFGGPIVYGHGEPDTKKNLFHYQTKKANEVFDALDGRQVEKALLADAPRENQVPLQGAEGQFPGLCAADMSADQIELLERTIKVILAPYRDQDVQEAISMLKAGGGLKTMHMAFYQSGDLNKDEVWDIWRLESPTFVWHFRGAPHVHTYVHIGKKA